MVTPAPSRSGALARADRARLPPLARDARGCGIVSVTKSVETVTVASQVADVMRRVISLMRMGRPGPAMVEIPADVARGGIRCADRRVSAGESDRGWRQRPRRR